MPGIDASQLLRYVIRPALAELGERYASLDAAFLLLATAAQESDLGRYLYQLGGGPARGIYQMEPATLHDLYTNYLAYRGPYMGLEDAERVVYDLRYATQIARLHYYRFPEPLPERFDVQGTWQFYKRRWNTPLGAAREEQFLAAWRRHVEPGLNEWVVV